jgi:predicted  nucleic acid-binding Zn-ribbon protein
VTIEIHRIPTGFGLNGGVIFESNSDQLIAKCDDCHNNKLKLVCKQKEECKKQFISITNSGFSDLTEKTLVGIKSNL